MEEPEKPPKPRIPPPESKPKISLRSYTPRRTGAGDGEAGKQGPPIDRILRRTAPPWKTSRGADPDAEGSAASRSEPDQPLWEIEAELEERDRMLRRAKSLLDEKERTLKEHEALLAARERYVAERERLFEERRQSGGSGPEGDAPERAPAPIADDSVSDSMKESFSKLKRELDEREKTLRESEELMREREAFIAESENTLFEKAQELQELETTLESLRDQLESRRRRLDEDSGEATGTAPEPPPEETG